MLNSYVFLDKEKTKIREGFYMDMRKREVYYCPGNFTDPFFTEFESINGIERISKQTLETSYRRIDNSTQFVTNLVLLANWMRSKFDETSQKH